MLTPRPFWDISTHVGSDCCFRFSSTLPKDRTMGKQWKIVIPALHNQVQKFLYWLLKVNVVETSVLFLCKTNDRSFCSLGCSVGGGRDQKISTHKELPELLAHSWLLCFWDRNYEEWIWAAGSSAADGAPEHEEVWAASTLIRAEEWHYSMAGVRQQLNGPVRAPGSPYWEPGAHVQVWDQRMESLQR